MVQFKTKKTLILLVYHCYVCKYEEGPTYKKAAQLIKHVQDVHGYLLPSRRQGVRRPAHPDFTYAKSSDMEYDKQHYACPSCWFHTVDIESLRQHINEKHDPPACEPRQDIDKRTTGRRRSASSGSDMVLHSGSRYEQAAVNTIFQQLQDITTRFKELLRLD